MGEVTEENNGNNKFLPHTRRTIHTMRLICLLTSLIAAFAPRVALAYSETAIATATVTRGYVSGITLVSGGSGYISEPGVVLEGGGGAGATAKAFLAGDKVGAIIVLSSGSGYTNAPNVIIDVPPKEMTLRVDIVPKITVDGPLGASTLVEYAPTLEGPWVAWTNVTIGRNGTVVVDLAARTTALFYRSVSAPPGYIWVAPGSFIMGSPPLEPDRVDEEVQHSVILTRGFWMSDHETTQSEYEDLMGTNPSIIKGPNLPVDTVSWNDAAEYCRRLTLRERAAGRIRADRAYRLPTEAEWEYVARAGTTVARYGPLNEIAWNVDNASFRPYAIRQKTPNPWGFYDMLGNVAEWYADWVGPYPKTEVTDPTGLPSGRNRSTRGGSYLGGAPLCRAAARVRGEPAGAFQFVGFRPVLAVATQ